MDPTDTLTALRRMLASTFTAYLHTHGMHWNVTGPRFPELHAMFGELYEELHEAVDEIAERIRQLGAPAPATYGALAALSSIPSDLEASSTEEQLLQQLAGINTLLASDARALAGAANGVGDQATVDLAARRQRAAEKAVWMLTSSL